MAKVFISYAHQDLTAARLYDELKAVPGVKPWLGKEDLSPGLERRPAIWKAIREADFFTALLSKRSAAKRGYVQNGSNRRAGRLVVRLKGGDPFRFGRGVEEAEQA